MFSIARDDAEELAVARAEDALGWDLQQKRQLRGQIRTVFAQPVRQLGLVALLAEAKIGRRAGEPAVVFQIAAHPRERFRSVYRFLAVRGGLPLLQSVDRRLDGRIAPVIRLCFVGFAAAGKAEQQDVDTGSPRKCGASVFASQ